MIFTSFNDIPTSSSWVMAEEGGHSKVYAKCAIYVATVHMSSMNAALVRSANINAVNGDNNGDSQINSSYLSNVIPVLALI